MYAIVHFVAGTGEYNEGCFEIYNENLETRGDVKTRLNILSHNNRSFFAYIVPLRNAEMVSKMVNFAHSEQFWGREYPYTLIEDERFDATYIGTVRYRRTTRGRKGVKTPMWKWDTPARWTSVT